MSSVIPCSEAEERLNPSLQGMHAFSSIVVYTLSDYFSENTVVQPQKLLIDKLRRLSVRFYPHLQKRADVFHI